MHMDAVRLALPGLMIAGLTGIYLSLVTFSVMPSGKGSGPAFLTFETPSPQMDFWDMPALQSVQLAQLREVFLPDPEFPGDPITLFTHQGSGIIDPSTGLLQGFEPLSTSARVFELIYLIHTGQGAWIVGVLLGISMLAVPFAIFSGIWMAIRRPKSNLKGVTNIPSHLADTVILVGSEGGTTWQFATALAKALSTSDTKVHLCDMNSLEPSYAKAKRLIVLTATYGNGEAPNSASEFMRRLDDFSAPELSFAVLGFGDRQFDQFCQFAHDVDDALREKELTPLLPIAEIDQQSFSEFNEWGGALARALGTECSFNLQLTPPKTRAFQLVHKQVLGQQVQAPVAILRLRTTRFLSRIRYETGDLLCVLAPGEIRPRFYSLASSQTDGMLEICVRQQPGGTCSGFLTNLSVGDKVSAFIKPNPSFRPSDTDTPLILVGAGAGIGPLMGFLRRNPKLRPAHLFWGGRHPDSDFLYQSELSALRADGRLSGCETAFSRVETGEYVQDRLTAKADDIRQLVDNGAEILICVGRNMGRDVSSSFQSILKPLGLSVEVLKSQNRYLEDVY
jgi:sulfite reductase (NADPH) flavoprotein alpha-component